MGTNVNNLNLNGWAPVAEDTDVCIQSALTKKYIDYAWTHGTGSRKLHQWDGGNPPSPNKTWKLEPTEPAGYLIRHAETGLCLIPTTIGAEGRVYLDVGPFGHGFTFKKNSDDSVLFVPSPLPNSNSLDEIFSDVGDLHRICLAGTAYAITVENASSENGAKIVLWPHASGVGSRWYLKPFNGTQLVQTK